MQALRRIGLRCDDNMRVETADGLQRHLPDSRQQECDFMTERQHRLAATSHKRSDMRTLWKQPVDLDTLWWIRGKGPYEKALFLRELVDSVTTQQHLRNQVQSIPASCPHCPGFTMCGPWVPAESLGHRHFRCLQWREARIDHDQCMMERHKLQPSAKKPRHHSEVQGRRQLDQAPERNAEERIADPTRRQL